MELTFEKWHGCRNDFIVMWLLPSHGDVVIDAIKRQAPVLCSKNGDGIGADGVLLLQASGPAQIPTTLLIINSDGSFAKHCGNGTRCAALSIYKRHDDSKSYIKEKLETVTLQIAGAEVISRFMLQNGRSGLPFVSVEMGVPVLDEKNSWHIQAMQGAQEILRTHGLGQAEIHSCSIGNPHLVIFNDGPAAVNRALIEKIGPNLQKIVPDGINVHLAAAREATKDVRSTARSTVGDKISELYEVQTWERGCGITPACGSGACSVAAVVLEAGFVARDEWIAIDMPGGRLYVHHRSRSERIVLAGPAVFVYSGKVEI